MTTGAAASPSGIAIRRTWTGLLIPALLAAVAWARAEDNPIRPGEERFKINFGVLLHRYDTRLRLDGTVLNREFGLERVLQLDRDRAALHASAIWRVAPRHRIGLRAFEIRREAERTLGATIELENTVVPLSTALRVDERLQFFGADYRYSIVRNRDVELAVIAGVLVGRYQFQFRSTFPSVDIRESETQPVPVIGGSLDVFLTPRWTASAWGQGVSRDFGRVDADVYSFGVSAEYMLTRHVGLGIGYIGDEIRLDYERGDFRGHIGLHSRGVLGYVQARF